MQSREVEEYLHEQIPLSKAMGVEVRAVSPECLTLSAPLAPNINHKETVFGGSASAVAILAAWALLYVGLRAKGIQGQIVIRRNTMNYEKPMTGDFTEVAAEPEGAAWERLAAALKRKRMARIATRVTLYCGGAKVGELEGEFVVLPRIA